MGRGLLAFLLAFAIGASPVSATVCQIRCAGHDNGAARTAAGDEHHGCHGGTSTNGLALGSLPHPCGHSDDFPVSIDQALQISTAPALVVVPIVFVPPTGAPLRVGFDDIQQKLSGLTVLPVQLRV